MVKTLFWSIQLVPYDSLQLKYKKIFSIVKTLFELSKQLKVFCFFFSFPFVSTMNPIVIVNLLNFM